MKQKQTGNAGIATPKDIENYIREISGRDAPVRAVIDNSIVIDDCRLVWEEDGGRELFLRAMPGEYPGSGPVVLSWAHLNSLYSFESIITGLTADGPRHMHFTIRFPETIAREERRKHVRVQPTQSNPIQVRFARPDSDFVDVETMDISRGGISFSMTEEESHFKAGDEVYLDISLPKYGNLVAFAAVRNVIHLRDLTRIGVEFSRISEDTYNIILQYVTALELENAQRP